MTNTEIIEKLKSYKGIIMYPTEEAEALKDAAIQALSQEPCQYWQNGKCNGNTEVCDDAVSRQAVLDGIDTYINKAQSTGTIDDLISFAELVVKALPSVMQKSGKWINKDFRKEEFVLAGKCTVCGQMRVIDKFCSHCGARMVEPQESEVRNDNSILRL